MFVTVFYAIYNLKTGEVSYCNGGHNPPHILKKNGEVIELPKSRDMMVGAFDGVKYHEATLQLDKGDAMIMFTDGVTEAMNESREEFGTARLVESLEDVAMRNCKEIIDTVKADIATFVDGAEQSDDITLLAFKRL
jgi:sigma-B regulation protein RsbU (phosphoserine phosphatase)